jgi:hypothetical protein
MGKALLRSRLGLFILVTITLSTCSELADSANPPATFQESDLAGTWVAVYGMTTGVDELVLREDKTFKQIYRNAEADYTYETTWTEWSLELFPDGRVRVQLPGARYYWAGIKRAEQEGLKPTDIVVSDWNYWAYFDPFSDDIVPMVHALILTVRILPSGEVVLAHMWGSSEEGFSDSKVFRRVNRPLAGTEMP